MASTAKIKMEYIDICPEALVSWYNVVPARMKKKDGGATPINQNKTINNNVH